MFIKIAWKLNSLIWSDSFTATPNYFYNYKSSAFVYNSSKGMCFAR